jgi:hypothetical protein
MNFQRGLSPKEALDIGQVALAPKIEIFFILDPSKMVESPNGKLEPSKSIVSHGYAVMSLTNIKEGTPERKLRFYGFIDEKGNFHRLSEYKGLYVEYDGVKYKIPE